MTSSNEYHFISELSSIGLGEDEAKVYESLLKKGRSTAGSLKQNVSNISRPLLYLILEKLIQKKLVEKKELNGKVAIFIAKHPLSLNLLVEEKQESLNKAKNSYNSTVSKLTSLYNINNGQPGIEYFEGRKALDEILADSLTSSETIYQYLDVDAQEKYLHEENIEYLEKRKKSKVSKKIIALDTESTRKAFLNDKEKGIDIDNVRLIQSGDKQLGVSMMIYDNKVSYLCFNERNEMVGIIIHNKEIYKMQKFLFLSQFATGITIG
jgi:sugar-specific transcriptional regulator TrmB